MTKKIMIILFLLFFPFFVDAYTKEDIIALVSNKKLCDSETESIYNQYFETYSRIIKQKEISEKLANQIYSKLSSALKIVETNKVCSMNDLNKIDSKQKSELYNLLLEGSKLIFKAPSLENKNTNITVNSDSTVDIYEGGKLVDKISLKSPKFNYVGYEWWFILLKYLLPITFIGLIIFTYLNKKLKILNHIAYIGIVVTFILNIAYFGFGELLHDIYTLVRTMTIEESTELVEIKVKNQKIEVKPTYGSKYAALKIESLNIDLPVYYGDSKNILKDGIGHTTTSSFPGEGKRIIYNTHNYKEFLGNLKNIKKDALIVVTTSYGKFEYQVTKTETLKANQFNKLKNNSKESLVLYTCYPFDKLVYSDSRFIVYASLIEEKWFDE